MIESTAKKFEMIVLEPCVARGKFGDQCQIPAVLLRGISPAGCVMCHRSRSAPVTPSLERKPAQAIKFIVSRQHDPSGVHLQLRLNRREAADGQLIRDRIINAIDSVASCLCDQNCCKIGCV